MIKVTKEQKGSALVVQISGAIEETTNFESSIGAPAPEMHIGCKEITRINSVGVKSWIKYFSDAKIKGTKLKFFECSTVIVEQLNMISNFACGGAIESVFVPFSCTGCRSELMGLFKVTDLKAMQLKIPGLKCSKCGNTAQFDDIPEEYFAFLDRF